MKRIIHYDLNTKLKDPSYSDVYAVLKELNYKQITESVYWIDSELTYAEICDKLSKVIHKSDEVYFISVNTKNELFCNRIESKKQ